MTLSCQHPKKLIEVGVEKLVLPLSILEGEGLIIDTHNSSAFLELPTAFGDWLSEFHWDTFWTLTFKELYGEQAAIRAVSRWANRHTIKEAYSMSWLFFFELTKAGALHAHGLTRHERHSRRHIWKDWFERHGIARGLPYNEDYNARFYIAKYLTKATVSYILDERR